MNSTHHIFLSYSRKDTQVMKSVKAKFESETLKVWTDEGIEPGTPLWKDSIEKAIENSMCLIVILSPDAKNSIWVKRELDYAEAQRKKVFPLLARGDESNAIPFALIGSQYVDLRVDMNIGLSKITSTLISFLKMNNSHSFLEDFDRYVILKLGTSFVRDLRSKHDEYMDLDVILGILNLLKSEVEKTHAQLVTIAKENGFVTYDDILRLLPNIDEQEPPIEFLDELMDRLLDAEIEILSSSEQDPLFEKAIDFVMEQDKASVSMIQHQFRIGYERAKNIIELMETNGIIGPYKGGNRPREIL